MNFSSILFVFYFLPVFTGSFLLCPSKYRFLILLLFSLAFYAYNGLFALILLLGMGMMNYVFGRLVRENKTVLIIAILVNVVVLSIFKYHPDLVLPAGISFYTFNNLAYLADVFRKEQAAEKNPLYYLAYITMFPTILMGPLSAYGNIRLDLADYKPSFDDVGSGLRRFLYGLIGKCLLADNLGSLYNSLLAADDRSILLNIVMIIVFGLQLYFDFASYSSMAIGIGRMIGFHYPENFDHPYTSLSIAEFWRRWHMSLNRFFTRYVYIPLGGNRVNVLRHIINIMIVWLLTGIWHGSTLNFLFWGIYYGILLVLEKYVWGSLLKKTPSFFRHLYVLFLVFIGYIFFSAGSMNDVISYFATLFTSPFSNDKIIFYLKENVFLLVVSILCCLKMPAKLLGFKENSFGAFLEDLVLLLLFVLSVAYILSGNFRPFLYGAF